MSRPGLCVGVDEMPKSIKGYAWFEQFEDKDCKLARVSMLNIRKASARHTALVEVETTQQAELFAQRVNDLESGPRARVLWDEDSIEAFKKTASDPDALLPSATNAAPPAPARSRTPPRRMSPRNRSPVPRQRSPPPRHYSPQPRPRSPQQWRRSPLPRHRSPGQRQWSPRPTHRSNSRRRWNSPARTDRADVRNQRSSYGGGQSYDQRSDAYDRRAPYDDRRSRDSRRPSTRPQSDSWGRRGDVRPRDGPPQGYRGDSRARHRDLPRR